MAVMLAATAFAQTGAAPRRATLNPSPNLLPAQTPETDKPVFLEDTTVVDTKSRETFKQRKSANPYDELLPGELSEKLTNDDLAQKAGKQQYYRKVAEPILSPDGKELVGVVENRYLTKDELKKRAGLMMKALPRSEQTGLIISSSDANAKQSEEDRQILVEGRVLDDWVRVATLAVHAEHASREVPSLKVNDAEVSEAIKKLSDDAKIDVTKIPVAMQSVMLSERELRQEVRDSLLVEKYMNEYVKRTISDKQMRDLFEKDPSAFIEPTKVHAFEMFIPKEAMQAGGELKKTEKIINSWRGSFSRCKTVDDLKELGEKIKKEQATMILSDMGWVLGTDAVDPEIHRAIFELKEGKTSKVIASAQGYQVFKAIERTEGEKPDFEKARPNVVAYLTNKLRDAVYENIKGQYGVRMAAGGLKNWKVVGIVNESGAPTSSTTPTAAAAQAQVGAANEPSLGALQRRTGMPLRSSATRRYRGAAIPSVESVVGAGVKPQTHATGVHRSGAARAEIPTPTPTK
jgi:parvulin-like peptidyl-prolyl isomerase